MTLSYRKANALVHDTYFLSFKVFFIEVCARKKFIVCVHAWVQKGLYCYSIHSNRLHGFLCGFQVYHNNSIESLFCQTRFFGCCLTKQLAKTEETKIKITFFQDTISVRKNLKNFIHISGSIQKGASSLRSWWRLTTSPRRTMPTMSSTATSWPQSFRYDQWYR